jgi:hypothetical protein
MSVLGTIGIFWLAANGALVVVLGTRSQRPSRPNLRARLFRWVIRTNPKDNPRHPRGSHYHA